MREYQYKFVGGDGIRLIPFFEPYIDFELFLKRVHKCPIEFHLVCSLYLHILDKAEYHISKTIHPLEEMKMIPS